MAKISKNLKRIRTEKLYTQEELASKIHVTRQTVSNWENDKCQPDLESLKLIAAVFQVPLEDLIYGNKKIIGEEPPKEESKYFSATRVILGIVGSIFIGIGLVLIFSYFWQNFPMLFKTVCTLAPIILSGGFTLFVFIKKQDNLIWRESSAILWCIGAVSSVALANALYNIHCGFEACLLIDIILCAPIFFLTDAVSPLIPFYYMIIHWGFLSGRFLISALMFAPAVIYTLYLRKHERFERYPFAQWTLLAAVTAYLITVLVGNHLQIFFIIPYFFLLYVVCGRDGTYSKPVKRISAVCVIALMAYESLYALITAVDLYGKPSLDIGISLITGTVIAIALTVASAILDKEKLKADIFEAVNLSLVGTVFISDVIFTAYSSDLTAGLVFIAVSAYGIFIIVKGVTEKRASLCNLGFALCFYQIVTLLSLTDMNELIAGLVFTVFGVALVGINLGLGLAKKRLNAYENKGVDEND